MHQFGRAATLALLLLLSGPDVQLCLADTFTLWPGWRAQPIAHWIPAKFEKARKAHVVVSPRIAKMGSAGLYDAENNVVYVADAEWETTLVHEVGHAIWYQDLSKRQQNEWRAIHAREPGSPPILHYILSPEQSFAEAFAYYVTFEGFRRRSPSVYLWMRDLIGREYRRP